MTLFRIDISTNVIGIDLDTIYGVGNGQLFTNLSVVKPQPYQSSNIESL